MQVRVNRQQLAKVLEIIKPISTLTDLRQLTNSTLLCFDKNTLRISAFGEEVFVDAVLEHPIENFNARVLLDSKTLYNIVSYNDVEFLTISTENSAEELMSGVGLVVIEGNSKYMLPVRSVIAFPTIPSVDMSTTSDFDVTKFLSTMELMSKFVDKSFLGYERGVFFSGKRVLATNHKHVIVRKEEFPFVNISFAPEIAKVLFSLQDVKVSFKDNPKTVFFCGTVDGLLGTIVIGAYPINDKCPVDKIFPIIGGWVKTPRISLEIEKSDLEKTLIRIKGLSFDSFSAVRFLVKGNTISSYYQHNQYEISSVLSCKTVPIDLQGDAPQEISFNIFIKDLVNVLSLSKDCVRVSVLVDKNLLLIEDEDLLFCVSLALKG